MRKVLLGACLCTAATGVAALSLGPSRGAVVLGAPIDLMFEVRPDLDKDLASSCLSARLVSGATTISDSRVQVTPILGGAMPMVRVQARVAADEPVLTVTLAAGCEGRVTRTYTFLADPPAALPANVQRPLNLATLGAAAAPRDNQEAATPVASGMVRRRGVSVESPAMEGGQAVGASARPQPRLPTPKPPERARVRPLATVPAAAAPERLIVEPLDLWLDTPLTLRMARAEPLLLSAPNEARRSEFAALWKTLNSTPEDLQQAMARLDKLQSDVAAQARQVEAERATVAELRERLAQVEERSFSAQWVYGLGGLLVLAVGGIAWLLRRTRQQELQAWQHSVALSAEHKDGAAVGDGPYDLSEWRLEPEAGDTWPHSVPLGEPRDRDTVVDTAIDAPDTVPVVPEGVETVPAAMTTAAPPQDDARVPQMVSPEALFDIQQQAEFFISIGEHEQAIEVLRLHIEEHGDAMPWAYLESLRLFHMLGRTESFNRLSEQFQLRFNARVPAFGQFQHGSRTLEDYPEALAQIEAVWSSAEVMPVLDGLLFRRGQEPEAERFDLAAFDDLLLLLAIVQTTPAHLRGVPPPRTRTTPRAAANPAGHSSKPIAVDLSLMPSGYDVLTPLPEPRATLDVDLSQLRAPDIAVGDQPQAAAPMSKALDVDFDLDRLELHFELDPMDKKR